MTAINCTMCAAWKAAYTAIFERLEAVQAERDDLRRELHEIARALGQHAYWRETMPDHLIGTITDTLNRGASEDN